MSDKTSKPGSGKPQGERVHIRESAPTGHLPSSRPTGTEGASVPTSHLPTTKPASPKDVKK